MNDEQHTALQDLRELLKVTMNTGDRALINALVATMALRYPALESSYTPKLVWMLERESKRQRQGASCL